MTRQQQITLDQCRFKREEAKSRRTLHLEKARGAKTDAEMQAELENLAHAHRDFQVWEGVVTKLVGLP